MKEKMVTNSPKYSIKMLRNNTMSSSVDVSIIRFKNTNLSFEQMSRIADDIRWETYIKLRNDL